jgi:CRP-like cAMP-binding protein
MRSHGGGSPDAIKAALRRAYPFHKAPAADIETLADHSEWITFADKQVVLKEGENCRSLYILARGKLVVKEAVTQNMELIIARITPGDVVGEIGFIDRKPASATVRADGNCELVRLDYLTLKELFDSHPDLERSFFRELSKTLAERLRSSNLALRRSMLSNNSALGFH